MSHFRRRHVPLLAAVLVAALLPGAAGAVRDSGQDATVGPVRGIVTVDAGERGPVGFAVTTADGRPLDEPVTVAAGADRVTFPAGTASGTARDLMLTVPAATGPAVAAELPLALTAAGATLTGTPRVVVGAHGFPYLDAALPVERRVEDLLGRMSLDDKIGQMTQTERKYVAPDPSRIADLRLGSILSGGGSVPRPNTADAWVRMVNTFQAYAMTRPLQIPLLYGIDAVHGHGNVHGATVFPHNIGLGSARDPRLTEQVYRATAVEMLATGIPWDFAPCVCVGRDERWSRTFETFGEDPGLVVSMTTAVTGIQSTGALATVKHFASDGDTEYGTGRYAIDQGVTVTSRADFDRIDLPPYVSGVRTRRAGSVMPSLSSVDFTEDGTGNPTRLHASRDLITGTLKGTLGFDGFVISDWEGIHHIPDTTGTAKPTPDQVRAGANAGIDMFMEPATAPRFQQVLKAEVTAGRVAPARIDDAVRRILRAKFALGLFEEPYASESRTGDVGRAEHRALAREAVAKSQVLLKNDGGLLPLRPDARVYVAGRNADDIGNQAGGWTIDWQGRTGRDTIPGDSVLAGIRAVAPEAPVTYSPDGTASTAGADVAVVAVGETPYAEYLGDVGAPTCDYCTPQQAEPKRLTLQPSDRAVVDRVCRAVAKCVVLLVSGRPQIVTDQLPLIDALVASWLPGSEGTGVADVLFGRRPFTARLPLSWPASTGQVPVNVGDDDYRPLYPFGWGLRTGAAPIPAGFGADGVLGTDEATLARVAAALPGADRPTRTALLAAARDAAQSRVVSGRGGATWRADIALADRAETAGDAVRAFALLRRVITG